MSILEAAQKNRAVNRSEGSEIQGREVGWIQKGHGQHSDSNTGIKTCKGWKDAIWKQWRVKKRSENITGMVEMD